MKRYAFEDFWPGRVLDYGAYQVTKEEIVGFAREFDPQPFHIDEDAARHSMLGGLVASGFHTAAMLMRMTCDGWMLDSTAMGAPGVEEIKWLKPIRPGDVLSVHAETLGARVSQSRPDMGLVRVEMHVLNQAREIAMIQRNYCMFGRRYRNAPSAPPTPAAARKEPAEPAAQQTPPVEDRSAGFGWYESVILGEAIDLGQYEFRRDDMLRFARAYDPQPFHLDDAAAAQSHFGALAASGWHTAAAYMQRRIATRQRQRAEALARGEHPPWNGPSPGIRDLKWLRPVHVGDVVNFTATPIEKRPISKPGWGLVTTQSAGVKQNGVKVFEHKSMGLLPMRG